MKVLVAWNTPPRPVPLGRRHGGALIACALEVTAIEGGRIVLEPRSSSALAWYPFEAVGIAGPFTAWKAPLALEANRPVQVVRFAGPSDESRDGGYSVTFQIRLLPEQVASPRERP